jgi:hypothetical protein
MRAQEFVTEAEGWMHMDPPEIARWREQMRVQGIRSGPESTLSTTAPSSTDPITTGPRYKVPDAPWNAPVPAPDTKKPTDSAKRTGPHWTPPDERDEYWAATPQQRGGRKPSPFPKQLPPTRDVELNADHRKDIEWFEPVDQKQKKQDLGNLNPAIPSPKNDKYRT